MLGPEVKQPLAGVHLPRMSTTTTINNNNNNNDNDNDNNDKRITSRHGPTQEDHRQINTNRRPSNCRTRQANAPGTYRIHELLWSKHRALPPPYRGVGSPLRGPGWGPRCGARTAREKVNTKINVACPPAESRLTVVDLAGPPWKRRQWQGLGLST